MKGRIVQLIALAAFALLILGSGAIAFYWASLDETGHDLEELRAALVADATQATHRVELTGFAAMRDYAAADPQTAAEKAETLSAAADRLRFRPKAEPSARIRLAPVGVAVLDRVGADWRVAAALPTPPEPMPRALAEDAQALDRLTVSLRKAAQAAVASYRPAEAMSRFPDTVDLAHLVVADDAVIAGLGGAQSWLFWRVAGSDSLFALLSAATTTADAALLHGQDVNASVAVAPISTDDASAADRLAATAAELLGDSPERLFHDYAATVFGDGALAFSVAMQRHSILALQPSVLIGPALIAALLLAALSASFLADQLRHSQLLRRQQAILKGVAAKQRELEASEERFRHLAESTNVVPWSADLDRQQFTYVGPQIEVLSGYTATTWRAAGFWAQHIHPSDRQRVMTRALEQAAGGRYATIDYRIRAADGRVLHVRNMLTICEETIGQGAERRRATVAHGFLLDVSELKRAAAALELARRKAEEANRVKSEFLASMSHELRTPLNAVIGFSEIMKEELFGPLDPQYREYAESVHASGRHLLDLINDVLDLSKIEAGRIELAEEETDLAELLQECRTLLRERVASAGLHEVYEIASDLPHLVMDGRRIKQVVLNLLSNAIKFTPPGGEVAVIARSEAGRGVMIAVRDSGIGMTEEEIPKALAKFGQIDGELARKHDGTGLGLPIAKSLIEMHGGRLEISSEKGKGTEMRIWLPESRIVTDAA